MRHAQRTIPGTGFLHMSLTEEAVDAISNYRQSLLKSPRYIELEQEKLRVKLSEIARRDSNIFYQVERQNFIGFPDNETFDREAYLTFRYLFESSYVIRRALVAAKRSQLETMARDLLAANSDLSRKYDLQYNQMSFDSARKRALLKAISQYNGVSSSRLFFAMEQAATKPEDLGISDNSDWIAPSDYKRRVHREFRNSAREIRRTWGISKRLLDFYITHIELKKASERLAVASAIAGGTVLVAWGVSRAFQSGHQLSAGSSAATGSILSTAANLPSFGPLGPIYGFQNLPQFVAIQGTPLTANQAAYFNHLSNLGTTNAYDVQLAMLNKSGETLKSITDVSSSIFGSQYNYGCAPALIDSLGGGFNQPGNILGANTNLNVREIGDSLVNITGTISGQNVHTNIRRVGDMLNISSF